MDKKPWERTSYQVPEGVELNQDNPFWRMLADGLTERLGEDLAFLGEPMASVLYPYLANLYAMVEEYEHALEHVAEEHPGQCDDCRKLAQGALDGVNRAMVLEEYYE